MPWSRYLTKKDLGKNEEDVDNLNNSPKKNSGNLK